MFDQLILNNLPVKRVVFFTLKNGKYLTENDIELKTEFILNYKHEIKNNKGYLILNDL